MQAADAQILAYAQLIQAQTQACGQLKSGLVNMDTLLDQVRRAVRACPGGSRY